MIEQLLPNIQPYARELIRRFASRGAQITSVYRNPAEQYRLWTAYLARGRRPPPVAPPGRSMHQVHRAMDIEAAPNVLLEMGLLWEYWGGRWGGRFGDPIHFEA